MASTTRRRLRLSGGTERSYVTAGEPSQPAFVLPHGFPTSSRTFRDVLPALSETAFVVAPDLPGFGASDVLPDPSFPAFGRAIAELLDELQIGPRYLYLRDWGAPVALHLAMQAPELVLGLVVQNGNAHRTGLGPEWAPTIDYWTHPSPEHEAAATAHLTYEGTCDQYLANLPPELAATISPEGWEEDWRVMTSPGRMDTQRALIADYGNHVDRFDAIAAYLARWQPPCVLLWGRHDAFFAIDEVLSWMQALPRMEAHVLDGGHLLETHATPVAALMVDFVARTQRALLTVAGSIAGR